MPKKHPEALIVNVSSGLALVQFPFWRIYVATRPRFHAYTHDLRMQLKGTRVAVVELATPGTETKLFRKDFQVEKNPEGHAGENARRAGDRGHRDK